MNYIALVLDSSGSMSHLKTKVVDMTNQLINDFKKNSQQFNQPTCLTLVTFGNKSKVHYKNHPINEVNHIGPEYKINGMTALFSAVTDAVKAIDTSSKNDSYIVYVLTDGIENASDPADVRNIGNLLRTKQLTDQWSFIFQLPKGSEQEFVNRYNIPNDNVRGWDISEAGLLLAQQQATRGFTNYYQARSAGKKSISNFFINLSNIESENLTALDKVTHQCKLYTLDKDYVIKDFVEKKTKKEYILGSTYYQLYKKELVQNNKDLLIMEKNKKEIYGGNIRNMIRLPNEDVKVDPYLLSKYDIFIQSTSVNRKCPRGTKLIVKTS